MPKSISIPSDNRIHRVPPSKYLLGADYKKALLKQGFSVLLP